LAFAFNLIVSALVISTAAWLSRRVSAAAGFLVAMPLASLVVLPPSRRPGAGTLPVQHRALPFAHHHDR
jgi:hypothetical protein